MPYAITQTMKIQTGLRFSPALIEKLKQNARASRMTFNGYVEGVLERAVSAEVPKLRREDYLPDEDILSLGQTIPPFSEEELKADAKLAYILGK